MKNLYKSLGISPVICNPTEFVNRKAYQEYLIKTHWGLVEYLEARLLSRFRNNRLVQGDLASVGYEALLKAARTFNRFQTAFLPYAYSTIENAMYKEIRALFPVDLKTSYKLEEGFNYQLVFCDSAFDNCETLLIDSRWDDDEQQRNDCLYEALGRLSTDDRDLIENHFGFEGEPLSLKDLGEQKKVSFQAVGKRKKRILKQMRMELNNDYIYTRCA